MLLFDSELSFFAGPDGLLARFEDPRFNVNVFNADVQSAHTITPELVREHFDLFLLPRINSGPGVVQVDWLEEFLSLESLRDGHFWRIEQTLFA